MKGRRVFTWICFASLTMIAFAATQIARVAGAPEEVESSELALTIYNQNFAVVRQPIALNLQPGLNQVRFSETTAHVEPDSVMLRDPSGTYKLHILEQNYRNDPLSEPLLLALNEGKVLDFEVQRDGKTEIVKGKIIRSGYVPHTEALQNYGYAYYQQQMAYANPTTGNGDPIVEVDGRLQFDLPGKPIFPSLGDDTIMKPTLDWTLRSDKPGKTTGELSYVTGGMNWQADYNVVAPPKGDILDVVGWVTMNNQSGKTFERAKIKLMAGEVNKVQTGYPESRAVTVNGAMMRDDEDQRVKEKAFDEYHLYTLPRLVTLRDRESKQVEFIRASGVESHRIYVYDGSKIDPNRYSYYNLEQIRNDQSYGAESNPDIWVMQEIVNSKSNNLGMPLPKGRVRFYRRDEDGQLEFTGENVIAHTPSDETLRIFTGNAFDIKGEHRQTDYRRLDDKHWIDESFEIHVRNHKKEAAEVRVVEHFNRCRTWELVKQSDAFNKTDSQTGEFRVQIPADGEKVITYTVHYTW
ncbi:MAG TPA: hypothetical protein VFA71_01825 [Terriglobales bacterium]|nr:hypothetical protein [Terriglobales bacterium]